MAALDGRRICIIIMFRTIGVLYSVVKSKLGVCVYFCREIWLLHRNIHTIGKETDTSRSATVFIKNMIMDMKKNSILFCKILFLSETKKADFSLCLYRSGTICIKYKDLRTFYLDIIGKLPPYLF